MSWYKDPELFISYIDSEYYINRIKKKDNVPSSEGDINTEGYLDFSKHLSLGNNKESDYDAFKDSLAESAYEEGINKFVNCQGLVVYWDYDSITWSRVEEHDSIFCSLPGIKKPSDSDTVFAEKLQAVEGNISELVAENSLLKEMFNNLQEQLNQEKNDKQELQQQVLNLTTKLEDCFGARDRSDDAEPWISGCTVPGNWVPFDELVVQSIPMDTPLTITETPGAPEFGKHTTTNVQASRFCHGMFPVVVVNVEDLIPNNGKARFDPDIWCSINSAGKFYAARKPSELEIDQHME